MSESRWRTVSLHGASENGIFGLPVEPLGAGERLWVGSAQEGLALLEDGEWRTFSSADSSLPTDGVRAILRVAGPDGEPWRLLGLDGGQLLEIADGPDFRELPEFRELQVPWAQQTDEAVTSGIGRFHDGEHELWIGTLASGMWCLRAGCWTRAELDGLADTWIAAGFCEQRLGERSILWCASSRGLARLDPGGWTLVPGAEGSAIDEGLRSATLIEEGERSTLWLATRHSGIARVDVTDPDQPNWIADGAVPAPPDPTVYSVLPDSQGRIYVSTNNGVQQLTREPGGDWSSQVFRRADGLLHDECNTNSQVIDAHDRCWVGTLGGLSLFDPEVRSTARVRSPKPLHLTACRVDGRPVQLVGAERLELAPGVRDLRFDFTLLAGLNEERTRYRTRLVGHEPSPTNWTAEHWRSLAGLGPGAYRFEVEARDDGGHVTGPVAVDFRIRPHWWQRSIVRVAGLLALILAVAAGVAVYNRALRARQRLLEREVQQRTAELHAANERLTELSFSDPLTGVANRRRLGQALGDALERARRERLPIGVVVLDIDHFKAYNDRHGHLAGDAALRAIAQTLASVVRPKDLVTRFGGEEFACLLDDAEESIVWEVAERLRAAVEALPPRTLGNETQSLTISIGVLARVPDEGDTPESLLEAADAALYRAKRDGRNRICA